MKFVFLDDIYPDAWASLPHATYDEWWHNCFGTFDAWDTALRTAGHESTTLIANMEHDILGKALSLNPDWIVSQNVGLFPPHLIRARGYTGKLAAFCSYAADGHNLRDWDVVFSSFRWLVDALNSNGQKAVYLPLAFGRQMLERVPKPPERDLPLTFVGGLGERIWKRGTDTMAAVARAFPDTFKWWGYAVSPLPDELRKTYQGQAYGHAYWQILMRSQVTLNRHGEISRFEGPQNMREVEANGVATLLLSDVGENRYGTIRYRDADELISTAKHFMDCVVERTAQGCSGQLRIFGKGGGQRGQTYEDICPEFLDAIESL